MRPPLNNCLTRWASIKEEEWSKVKISVLYWKKRESWLGGNKKGMAKI